MHLHKINAIQCKTQCVPRTEEREINQWCDSKDIKINYDDPKFLDAVIEKSEAMQ